MACESHRKYYGSTAMQAGCHRKIRHKERTATALASLEPALILLQGILPARMLSRDKANTQDTSSMTSQQGRVEKEASAN
jgi:hypothetical protein